MSVNQGITLDFGPTGSTFFQSSPWPYPTPNHDDNTIKKVIAVAPNDSLILHLSLNNFDWGQSDCLLILIARNHDEVPSAFFLKRQTQNLETSTFTVASFDHLQKSGKVFGKARFHFSQVADKPESSVQPGFVFREYKRFAVKIYRLQVAGARAHGRSAYELFGSIRFGASNDDLGTPPKRQNDAISNIHLNIIRTDGPLADTRYHVPREDNWPMSYVIYYRSQNWFQAFQGQRVEECNLGFMPFTNGLFSQPGATVTYKDGRSFVNTGPSNSCSLEASAGPSNHVSTGVNGLSGMRRAREDSTGDQSVIDVTANSLAKRRRTENVPNGTSQNPAGTNPDTPIVVDGQDLVEGSGSVTGNEITPDVNAENAQPLAHDNHVEAMNCDDGEEEDLYGVEVNLLGSQSAEILPLCTGGEDMCIQQTNPTVANNATATNNGGAQQPGNPVIDTPIYPTHPIVEQNLYGGLPHHENHTGHPDDLEYFSDDEDDVAMASDVDDAEVLNPSVLQAPLATDVLAPAEAVSSADAVTDISNSHSDGSETVIDPEEPLQDTSSVALIARLTQNLTNLRVTRDAFAILRQTNEVTAISERMRAMEARLMAALMQMSEDILNRSEADLQHLVIRTAPHNQSDDN